MVSKKHNKTKNVGKNRTKKDRTLNQTRKIVDRSRRHNKTTRGGGINQNEYISVEFFKNRLDKNIGRIIRVVQDPIFGNKTNDIADMSYLFGKRMGEIDEVIDIMKHGRKKKPYKRILYRLRFNDTHGPVMSYSQKPIKQGSSSSPPGPTLAFSVPTVVVDEKKGVGRQKSSDSKAATRKVVTSKAINPSGKLVVPTRTRSGRTSTPTALHNAKLL